jgi:hypothetical protein
MTDRTVAYKALMKALEGKGYSKEAVLFFKENNEAYQLMSHVEEGFVDGFFAGIRFMSGDSTEGVTTNIL